MRDWPSDAVWFRIASAAYVVVADAVVGAEDPVVVVLEERDGSLVVLVEGAVWEDRLAGVEDRVGAVGGITTVVWQRFEAVLPARPQPADR